jgi:predicted restriction endonuclease
MTPSGHGPQIWHQFEVRPEDLSLVKNRYSALLPGTSLLECVLRGYGIQNLLIGGTKTNVCCESTGRDARFRVTVVTQYRFTCALTGYGLHTQQGHALVEAAHVHQFAKSKNNNPDNGLALSRDAHWMFDRGLWTISETNRIIVADEVFKEWGPESEWLKVRNNQEPIYKPEARLRPAPKHLSWHRNNVFNGMDC